MILTRRNILRQAAASAALLAACPARGAGLRPAMRPLATLGLRDIMGFVVVQAMVNGTPVSMLLDTGADTGLITPQAAAALHLAPDPGVGTVVQGTGGGGAVRGSALLGVLSLGGLRVTGMSVPVAPLPAAPRVQPAVAGLLGADLFARFDLLVNLSAGVLALYPPGALATPDGVPLQRLGPRLATMAVLDGTPLVALLDTGARSILLSEHAALGLGVAPETLARDPGGVTSGIDLHEVPYHWHRFGHLQIGGQQLPKPTLTVTRLQDEADMLLGTSWFTGRTVWISWAAQQMLVRDNAA